MGLVSFHCGKIHDRSNLRDERLILVHGFKGLSLPREGGRSNDRLEQEDHGLETSLGYTVNSRPAWAAQQDLVSESKSGPKRWLRGKSTCY